jgi:hypothetical protein
MGFGGGNQSTIAMPGGRPLPLLDIIPSSYLSLGSREAMKRNCITQALKRAVDKRIINDDYSNAIIRQIRPTFDLNYGVNANQSWVTTALVAGTQNAVVNNFQVPVNQLIVIYGLSTNEASPSISEWAFQRGTTGGGGINERAGVQRLYNQLEVEGYLSKAVLYDPQDIIYITALPFKANANGEQWVLFGYTVEPIGLTIATSPQ